MIWDTQAKNVNLAFTDKSLRQRCSNHCMKHIGYQTKNYTKVNDRKKTPPDPLSSSLQPPLHSSSVVTAVYKHVFLWKKSYNHGLRVLLGTPCFIAASRSQLPSTVRSKSLIVSSMSSDSSLCASWRLDRPVVFLAADCAAEADRILPEDAVEAWARCALGFA